MLLEASHRSCLKSQWKDHTGVWKLEIIHHLGSPRGLSITSTNRGSCARAWGNLAQWVYIGTLKQNVRQNHWEGILKHRWLASKVSDSVGRERGLKICTSNKFPGEAHDAGQGITLTTSTLACMSERLPLPTPRAACPSSLRMKNVHAGSTVYSWKAQASLVTHWGLFGQRILESRVPRARSRRRGIGSRWVYRLLIPDKAHTEG